MELYKEIKKNGPARCVRAALTRFSQLARHIRPAKCRPYLVNLLPCLQSLAARSEEQLHESLAAAFPNLFAVLGPHSNDNEIRILLKAFLANVGSSSAVIRRTTATILTVLGTGCRHPATFSSWLLVTATQLLLPLNTHTAAPLVTGVLGLTRNLVTAMDHGAQAEVEPLVVLYEVCLKLTEHRDHNIVTASLETLAAVLRSAPPLLVYLVTSPGGLGRSRLTWDQDQGEPATPASGLAADQSLTSPPELADSAMDNSVLSFPDVPCVPGAMDTSNNEADSEGEEPREEIVIAAPAPKQRQEAEAAEEGEGVALHQLARQLASRFLLAEDKGELVSDRVARVSVKTLAVSCLAQVAELCPQVWGLTLHSATQDSLTSVTMADLLLYLDHQDPGLRGGVARWAWRVVRGAGLESGGQLGRWFAQTPGQRELGEVVGLLGDMCGDSSSITLRQVLAGLGGSLGVLLQSDHTRHAAPLLERLAGLADNQYWLVRVELAAVLAEVEVHAATYVLPSWPRTRLALLTRMLGDEDSRVRSAAVAALVRASVDNSIAETSGQCAATLAGARLASRLYSSAAGDHVQVFPALARVLRVLATADTKSAVFGCLEFVCAMTRARPPVSWPKDWGLTAGPGPGAALLARCVKLLTSSSPCQDLTTHAHLLTAASRVFAGLASLNLDSNPRNYDGVTSLVANDASLAEQAELLLGHLLKLLCILHHVLEDTLPSIPTSKPSLPSLPNSTLSPIKKKSSEPSTPVSPPATDKTFNFKDDKKSRGHFYGSPYYMKQYELVRSSYSVYRTSLDPSSEEKLVTFTNSVLDSFALLLDYSLGHDIGKQVEECLAYTKSCLQVSAARSLNTVQSLLKCLFKCNQPFTVPGADAFPPRPPPVSAAKQSATTFEQLIGAPYSRMTVECSLVTLDTATSSLDSGPGSSRLAGGGRRSTARATDRSSLASYIRMFEPVVIKALKLYTVTSSVELQTEVLQLLVSLVRLRVNYCLLDSDQIFIGFVTKQLESIQEGEITHCELLIPHIFEFLVLLSYERYHSKTVIDVPSILQLCEGLAACRDSPHKYVVPALEVIAVDLFERSSAEAELETQREVVVSMLMKQMASPRVWAVVARVLALLEAEEGGAGEDKARRLSRQVVEVLVPLLCSHGVAMTTRHHLDSLKCLLRSLSPGALRPCDKIMSSLLSCHCDLANMSEVTSWLGFTIATFLTIFHLSPEEAVLGRLQELGIMLGSAASSSLLETSVEDSMSLSQEGGAQSPELTLSVFFLHVVGSGVSKLHQLAFSPASREAEAAGFLEQELSDLLLLHIYILQSGRCPRLARAMVQVARSPPGPGLHNTDLLTDLVMQLSHAQPGLATQWLYILVLLDKCPPPVWAQCLAISRGPTNTRSHEQSAPAPSLHQELVRTAAISILANRLVNNTSDGELLAWFLSSQIKEIVANVGDSNIREFVNSIHRQPAASGLFLESVSARLETMRSVRYLHNILCCLQPLHVTHSGRLILLVFTKFLSHPVVSLATKAAQLASARVETLLSETETFVQEQLSSTEVATLKEILASRSLAARHGRLVALLNRLAVAFYDLSPLEMTDHARKFNPSSVSGVSLDKNWFLQQVKRCCCGSSPAPAKECAKLLANLSLSDIMLVMTSKDFKLKILEECLEQGITLPDGRAPSLDSLDRLPGLLSDPERSPAPASLLREGPPLYRAASQVLLQHIKNLVELLPRPCHVYRPHVWWEPGHAEAKYSARLDDLFSSWEGLARVAQLLPGLAKLLTTYPRLPGRRPALPPHSVLEMVRFAVLCLELVKWTVASCRSEHLAPGQESIVSQCLHIAGLTFSNPHLSSALALASNNILAASAVLSLTDFVLASCPQLRLPTFPWPTLASALEAVSPPPLLVASSCLARLLLLAEQLPRAEAAPAPLARSLPAIICLARLPHFSFLARAPPLAFSLGWEPQLSLETGQVTGDLAQEWLQEAEILRQFIWRVNTLGWTSKAQFEETWMCLLSVLNVAKEDLTNAEVAALSQTTALVVSALSSLLVATLALPVAGVPGTIIFN